jgi:hypothetical protein
LSYDKAYSDEYKAWKKRQKEWELTGIRKLAPEDDVADVDPESLYDEVGQHPRSRHLVPSFLTLLRHVRCRGRSART